MKNNKPVAIPFEEYIKLILPNDYEKVNKALKEEKTIIIYGSTAEQRALLGSLLLERGHKVKMGDECMSVWIP